MFREDSGLNHSQIEYLLTSGLFMYAAAIPKTPPFRNKLLHA
ncbi:hypothetical protein [Paenibacillus sp. FSL E2-0178]